MSSRWKIWNKGKKGRKKWHQKFTKKVGPAIMWLIESQEAGGVIAKTSFSFECLLRGSLAPPVGPTSFSLFIKQGKLLMNFLIISWTLWPSFLGHHCPMSPSSFSNPCHPRGIITLVIIGAPFTNPHYIINYYYYFGPLENMETLLNLSHTWPLWKLKLCWIGINRCPGERKRALWVCNIPFGELHVKLSLCCS